MRLFWNLNGDTITTTLGNLQHLARAVQVKARQDLPLELQFHRDRVPELLPEDSAVFLGIKKKGEFDGAYLASADTWTRPASEDGFYTSILSTATDPIDAALANLAAIQDAIAELQYFLPGAVSPSKARTFLFRIDAAVNQGDETTPTEADPPWPPHDQIIRFFPAVTGYTGGTGANLDGVATLGQALDVAAFVHPLNGLQTYRLTAGTDAESSPAVIRPDDYDADDNAFVWKLVSSILPESDPFSVDEFIRFLPLVTGYTGGGSTKLDGLVTAGQDALRCAAFVHPTAGLQTYRLAAGTDAEDSPAIIRPDDYDADDNAFVWTLVSTEPPLADAPSDGNAYGRKDGAWVRVELV